MKYRKHKYNWESNLKKGFVEEIKRTDTGFIFKAKDNFIKEENPMMEDFLNKVFILPGAAKALNSLIKAGSTWPLLSNNWSFWEGYIACSDGKDDEGNKFFISNLLELEKIIKASDFQAVSLQVTVNKNTEGIFETDFSLLYAKDSTAISTLELEKISLAVLSDFSWQHDSNYITNITFNFLIKIFLWVNIFLKNLFFF